MKLIYRPDSGSPNCNHHSSKYRSRPQCPSEQTTMDRLRLLLDLRLLSSTIRTHRRRLRQAPRVLGWLRILHHCVHLVSVHAKRDTFRYFPWSSGSRIRGKHVQCVRYSGTNLQAWEIQEPRLCILRRRCSSRQCVRKHYWRYHRRVHELEVWVWLITIC